MEWRSIRIANYPRVPLPPGTPYEQQQLEIYQLDVLKQSPEELADLATRLRRRIDLWMTWRTTEFMAR